MELCVLRSMSVKKSCHSNLKPRATKEMSGHTHRLVSDGLMYPGQFRRHLLLAFPLALVSRGGTGICISIHCVSLGEGLVLMRTPSNRRGHLRRGGSLSLSVTLPHGTRDGGTNDGEEDDDEHEDPFPMASPPTCICQRI